MTKHLQHAIEPPWQGWGDFLHMILKIFFCMASQQHPEKGKPVRVQIRERDYKYIYIIRILFILV